MIGGAASLERWLRYHANIRTSLKSSIGDGKVMPEPKDHASKRGAIESVLRWIPGFSGYLEKEYRRESDELQRDWLADRLRRSKRGLDTYARSLAEAGQIDGLPELERMRARLDRLISRIRGAMQGYSGFFDLVQIDEGTLDQVYEHDVSLMEQVAQLADAVDGLAKRKDESQTELQPLFDQIEALDDAWDQREDILKGLG